MLQLGWVRQKLQSRRRVIMAVVGVVVVIGLVSGGVLYKRHQDDVHAQQAAAKVEAEDKKAYDTSKKQLDLFKSQRRYDDAISAANKYLSNSRSSQNAALMLASMGIVYEQKGDCTAAITAYKQAIAKNPDKLAGVYSGVARCAFKQKDYKTTIEYNNHAISVLEASGDPNINMDIVPLQRLNDAAAKELK